MRLLFLYVGAVFVFVVLVFLGEGNQFRSVAVLPALLLEVAIWLADLVFDSPVQQLIQGYRVS